MSQSEGRLAAIMFTDRVGYTALGQRNESLSLTLVKEQRKLRRAGASYCFALKGMKERAHADMEAWHEFYRDEDACESARAFLYAVFGEREKALPMIEELISKVGESSARETDIVEWLAILGDRDAFFNWIDRAISAKRISAGRLRSSLSMAELRFSPYFDEVREDPRFPEIFKKLGLPY